MVEAGSHTVVCSRRPASSKYSDHESYAKRKGQTIGQNNYKMGGGKRGRGGENGVGMNMIAVGKCVTDSAGVNIPIEKTN